MKPDALNQPCRAFSLMSCSGVSLELSQTGPSSSSHGPFLQEGQGMAIHCVCAGAQRARGDIPQCPQLPWSRGKASPALRTLSSPWIQMKHRMKKAVPTLHLRVKCNT